MGRPSRLAPGGYVYHVRHRAADRRPLFQEEGEYAAFEAVLREAGGVRPVRLLAYCLMPDHWHLIVWPEADGALSRYVHWLTATHARRTRIPRRQAGAAYRGRFRSFPVREGPPLWAVGRYVERNPVRAGFVAAAEAWRWSSLWHEVRGRPSWLSEWPRGRPPMVIWQEWVNRPEAEAELAALRRCAERGAPYGDAAWVAATAERLGLQSALRARGRPPKSRGPVRPVRGVNLFSAQELLDRMAGRPGARPGESAGNPVDRGRPR